MSIKLTDPDIVGTFSLEKSINERESIRKFRSDGLEPEKLSQLLWAAQGRKGHKRTVPSAGGTYPLDIYVSLKGNGLYWYNLKKHTLEMKIKGDLNESLAVASLKQSFIDEAPLNIIICADYERCTGRYGERGVRYTLIEVGHCAQNIHLEAVALGLGSVPIGAFQDDKIKILMDLPSNIEPLYIIPIGYPR